MLATYFLIGDSGKLGWNTNYKIPLTGVSFATFLEIVTKKLDSTKNKKTQDIFCCSVSYPVPCMHLNNVKVRLFTISLWQSHRPVNFWKDQSSLDKTKSVVD